MQRDIEGQGEEDKRDSLVVKGGTSVEEVEKDHDSLALEDGSLLQLYESRIRRLRDYESAILSPYNLNLSHISSTSAESYPADKDHRRLSGRQGTVIHSTTIRARNPPASIIVEDTSCQFDNLDDLTLLTGVDSQMHSEDSRGSQKFAAGDTSGCISHELVVSKHDDHEESDPERKDPLSDNSSTLGESEKGQESNRTTRLDEETNANPTFSCTASPDSMYETYAVTVDHENDDRAVEILLYSAARPHMRGFHFAWMSFFVAFFTWFAIAPLLSEVAMSLELNREQIWTSNVFGVAGSAVTRVLIGPINDIYGPRWTISATLLLSAIPTGFAGLAIQGPTSLYIIRLLIGVAGSAFVTCQFWSTNLFIPEVAGTANSLTAGWGNLGGGVAQVVMGSLIFPLFKVMYGGEGYGNTHRVYISDDEVDAPYDRASDLAWRTAMVVPACMSIYMAYACLRYSDDSPKGNFKERKAMGLMQVETAQGAILRSCCKWNTWWLVLQYGCCFGVELTMINAATLYFQEEYGLTTESAAAIASIFGWMNLFARGIGGFCSDMANAGHGMRGRLFCQFVLLLAEGGLVCLFSTTHTLATSIVVMVIFSIFVQASEGSTFAIVPYVDYGVTGSVTGVVGAGGNVGGVVFSLIFRELGDRSAFLTMGFLIVASSFLTILISIEGHQTFLGGQDSIEVLERRGIHVEQLGTMPNVEIHGTAHEASSSRQTTLRPGGPSMVSGVESIPTDPVDP